MRLSAVCWLIPLASFALSSPARAQGVEFPAPSPAARVDQRVGVTDLSVVYSSPAVKGRSIWGGLVPYDQLWRTGANAATKFTASRDFTFGGKPVPAGTYSLFTIPGRNGWTVILNSKADLSGTQGYDEKNDVARITVTPETLPAPRERMTFVFSDTTDGSTNLDLEWERLRVRVPITVDTKAFVRAGIDKSIGEAWRPHFLAARWLLDSGGDLDEALRYANTSIEIKPGWWNNWVKAQILAKQGKTSDAIAAARRSQELGKDDNVYGFFKDDIAKALGEWQNK
ncbi:MAG: DUF2911 domain-containing protein [Acidobacteria bacterium]|nr:DUF2911 domain-containing protein [Acidobacteriota bacterium]